MICIQKYPVTLSAIITKVRDIVFFLMMFLPVNIGVSGRWIEYKYIAMMEWYWHRKTTVLRDKPAPIPLCLIHSTSFTFHRPIVQTKSNWIWNWSIQYSQYQNSVTQYILVIVQQLCTVYNVSTRITNYYKYLCLKFCIFI